MERRSCTGHPSIRGSSWQENNRLKLCQVSKGYPLELDAKFSSCKAEGWDSEAAVLALGPPSKSLSYQQQASRHALVVDVDGNAWSSRLPHLLVQPMAVLKEVKPNGMLAYYGFVEAALTPGVHYQPFIQGTDPEAAGGLIHAIRELKANASRAEAMSRAGTEFALSQLNVDGVLCYWHHLILEYETRLAFKPSLHKRARAVTFTTDLYAGSFETIKIICMVMLLSPFPAFALLAFTLRYGTVGGDADAGQEEEEEMRLVSSS